MLKKLFTNRFFIIVLCAAVLVSIIPVVLTAMGQGSYVRSALQTLASPFQWCFSKAGEGLRGFSEYFATVGALREENARLRAELDEKNGMIYDAALIEDENRFLRNYLGIKSEHYDFVFQEAVVIGRESTNYSSVYTLSGGRLSGIDREMAVISDKGLIGFVSDVGSVWSRVTAITESSAAVGAFIERTGVSGTVRGSLELRGDGLCMMTRIDPDADIAVGDRVITSGIGSFYPRGIAVGEVMRTVPDASARTLTAIIRPYADMSDVTRVMVITGFEEISDETE